MVLGYSLAAGLAAQPLFRRYEPSIVFYVFQTIVSASGIAYYSYAKDHLAPVSSVLMAVLATLIFNCSLGLAIIAYRLSWTHPLASYPGPILAKVTKWWMAYWIRKGDRHLLLVELHEKYGPWVRIGPNELSVSDPAAMRPIYSQMFRAPFYQGAPAEADALISLNDRVKHDHRLLAWSKAFSTDLLKMYRGYTQARTQQLLEIFQKQSKASTPIDFSHWISLWSMDNNGDMSFSGGFETMAAGKDNEGWMQILSIGVLFVGILGQVPWMRGLIALLPQPGPIVTFHKFLAAKVLRKRDKSDDVLGHDILGIIQDEASGGPRLSRQEAAADASLMVVAGADTVAQGLCALFRFIVADKEIQEKLRTELTKAFNGTDDLDANTLLKLPYLDACVQEALRILPPVAGGPPRYCRGDGKSILGKWVPPGTTIACPTYAMHRDSKNFFRAQEFFPERWLSGSNCTPHNLDAFVPFSYGPGVCIGKPVALYNMKLFTAKMLLSFKFSLPPQFDTQTFDASWKEHYLWLHDPLMIQLEAIE